MTADALYLRPDVAVEPLISRWYAWAQLVSPATSALHLARSQLDILDSFARNPGVHAAAVKNPAMRGGPFLDLAPERVDEVRALADELRTRRAPALQFASAVAQLERTLDAAGDGTSLEPLYAQVPEPLRGLVELVYDTRNRPGFRLLERLSYASPLYDRSAQGFTLRRLEDDRRPFVLSTPRLAADAALALELPFDHAGVDALFEARRAPRPLGELRELLELPPEADEPLRGLLTEAPPRQEAAWDGEAPRVRYFGHACVLVETRAVRVLIDPLIGYASADEPPRFTFEDLPERLDYVLITHAHQDHVVLESLLPLRRRIGTLVVPRAGGGALEDPSLKLMFEAIGFPNVVELDELESLPIDGGEIVGLPFLGEHGDLAIRTKLAHLIRLDGRSMVFAADSCNLEPRTYERIRDVVGAVDTLFLGMECDGAPMSWLYGALLSTPLKRGMDRTRRLCGSDHAQALAIVELLGPRRVFVYAMGQEPWCGFITSIEYADDSPPIVESNRLLASCREKGIEAERLYGCQVIPF